MKNIDQYLETNAARFEEELCDFLRIPSVSADPACRGDMHRAAEWLADQFRKLKFAVEIIPTAGHPLVFAESPKVPGAPTVLVYGHYDVQPPEPLEKWTTKPFEPARRDGNIVARGATDDKGQVFTHIKSVEAWTSVAGHPPINLKFLIEGEEEIGSVHLEKYIGEHTDKLACDCVVISDSSQFAPGMPAITYGLRGIAYFEMHVSGPNRDLHSGTFGGSITNPINAVCKIMAGLIDSDGRITVPGFYDDVTPLTDRERKELAALPFDEKDYCKQIGVSAVVGEVGYTTTERRSARPTFDICGIWGGYQGEGSKTVLPATAGVKFSFRLVPKQDPKKITAALERKIKELCPPGVTYELIGEHAAPGMLISLESPYIEAAAKAIEHAFGCRPVFTRDGGSIPIVATFCEKLDADAVLIGWGQEDDNCHSPNEKFSLADFHRGIKASAKLFEELTKK